MKTLIIAAQIAFLCFSINVAVELQPRIINGYPARTGQFPYFAFLEIEGEGESDDRFSACGATLISADYLLTAAHCIANAKRVMVNLGASNFQGGFGFGLGFGFDGEYVEILVEKEDLHVHPYYMELFIWNDIGLIHLPEKIDLLLDMFPHIRPARLPQTCDSIENIEVIAMGQGATQRDGNYSPQLNFVTLKTLPLNRCRWALPIILFRKSVICASNAARNQSVFYGDSGGPLVKSDHTIIGISSFVNDSPNYIGVSPQGFTNIYSYLKWIGEITGMDLPKC